MRNASWRIATLCRPVMDDGEQIKSTREREEKREAAEREQLNDRQGERCGRRWRRATADNKRKRGGTCLCGGRPRASGHPPTPGVACATFCAPPLSLLLATRPLGPALRRRVNRRRDATPRARLHRSFL